MVMTGGGVVVIVQLRGGGSGDGSAVLVDGDLCKKVDTF